MRIVVQDEPRGQADAIARVAPFVDEPLLIVFSDTLADVTFDHLADVDADGLIYVKEIADPSRMGIIVVEDDRIVDMIEKPQDADQQPGDDRDVLLQGPRRALLGDRSGAGAAAEAPGRVLPGRRDQD